MYILSKDTSGQLSGFLEMMDLEVGKEYTILDALYKQKGFYKMDEFRIKHWFSLLVSDKWGQRPRTSVHEPGTYDVKSDAEMIGNTVITKGQYIIILERVMYNQQDPYVTILEVTDVYGDIDAKVIEKFRFKEYEKVMNNHRFSYMLRLANHILDVDEITSSRVMRYQVLDKAMN